MRFGDEFVMLVLVTRSRRVDESKLGYDRSGDFGFIEHLAASSPREHDAGLAVCGNVRGDRLSNWGSNRYESNNAGLDGVSGRVADSNGSRCFGCYRRIAAVVQQTDTNSIAWWEWRGNRVGLDGDVAIRGVVGCGRSLSNATRMAVVLDQLFSNDLRARNFGS